jgi:hypothetical protein
MLHFFLRSMSFHSAWLSFQQLLANQGPFNAVGIGEQRAKTDADALTVLLACLLFFDVFGEF